MMCGGVDARALARRVPMSIVAGSTRPSHDDEDVLGCGNCLHSGQVRVGHGVVVVAVVAVVAVETVSAGVASVTTGGRLELALTLPWLGSGRSGMTVPSPVRLST